MINQLEINPKARYSIFLEIYMMLIQLSITKGLLYIICQKQICPPNWAYMPHIEDDHMAHAYAI